MAHDPRAAASLFTQVDITSGGPLAPDIPGATMFELEQLRLLREILAAQDRQNELLEEVVSQLGAPQRQRQAELGQWKQANPHLAQSCKVAAETLSRVQTEFLAALTENVNDNSDVLMDGEFMLNEFVDRFGPRLAHLNGVLQVLSQLGNAPTPAAPHQ